MAMTTIRTAATLLALAVFVSACGREKAPSRAQEEAEMPPATMAAESATSAMSTGGPNDAQIAAIVLAANSADSTAGVLAESKGTDPRIKEFGRRMVVDHGAVNRQATALATRLGLTPEQNPTSTMLVNDGQQNMQKLQGLSGAEFDRAYIDHEVTLHRQVLDALNQTLIPNASNPELKALLEEGRPIFTGHLEMAEQIQSSLGSS